MKCVTYMDVRFGDPEHDRLYLKHRRDNFDPPDFTRRRTDVIEEALRLSRADKILDAGCGIGTYSLELARRGYSVVGLDLSATFLEEAERARRKEGLEITFLQGDYNELHFTSEFSAIFVIAAFFYRNKRALLSVLGRLHRALEPEGSLLLDHPNPPLRCLNYPQVTWADEGNNVFTLSRADYLKRTQQLSFLWLKLDMNRGLLCRSTGKMKWLTVSEFTECIRSAGFSIQSLHKKSCLEPFDPKTDDGFFLVARKAARRGTCGVRTTKSSSRRPQGRG